MMIERSSIVGVLNSSLDADLLSMKMIHMSTAISEFLRTVMRASIQCTILPHMLSNINYSYCAALVYYSLRPEKRFPTKISTGSHSVSFGHFAMDSWYIFTS